MDDIAQNTNCSGEGDFLWMAGSEAVQQTLVRSTDMCQGLDKLREMRKVKI